MYSSGHRELQDRFDSRRIADRLEAVTVKPTLADADRAFIAAAPFFFLATAGADGWPDCSYKGGDPGFVRVVDDQTLAWDDYDGNGQFRSLGNVTENPKVQLLFIDFAQPRRLRVHGLASLAEREHRLVVTLAVERVFPNCPRYIHRMTLDELSPYAPRPGHEPPEPSWKSDARFCDALPREQR
jgi:predicted pyridoxine 5'-phosphate oxidase superfamily flavin-nucleotide-binding protein